jgi:hypothetical protein
MDRRKKARVRRVIRGALPAAAIAGLLVLSSLLALTFANRAVAQPVVIEATAPIEDPSEDGINAALDAALESAVRGALALGLGWVQVHGAYLGDGYVGVQVIAAARAPADAGSGAAGRPPDTDVPAGRAMRILYDL